MACAEALRWHLLAGNRVGRCSWQILGAIGGSLSLVFGDGLVALAAGIPLLRTWCTPEVISDTFGPIELPAERDRYWLARRWGIRVGKVPQARVQRDIPYWTIPEIGRVLLCDIWQPPAEVPPSGLALVYLHVSAWTLLDKDCGTRTLFSHLVAQGHVVMDVAYRLYPETEMRGMVGDAKRAVAWLKANAATYGVDNRGGVLCGASAGGHVALLAAYTNGHPELTPADVMDGALIARSRACAGSIPKKTPRKRPSITQTSITCKPSCQTESGRPLVG